MKSNFITLMSFVVVAACTLVWGFHDGTGQCDDYANNIESSANQSQWDYYCNGKYYLKEKKR